MDRFTALITAELRIIYENYNFYATVLNLTNLHWTWHPYLGSWDCGIVNCGSNISVVDYLNLKHRNDKLFRTQWRCLVTVVNHWWWVAVTMSWQNLIHWSYCQEKCKMQHFLAMLHRSFAHCCLNYLKVLSKNVEYLQVEPMTCILSVWRHQTPDSVRVVDSRDCVVTRRGVIMLIGHLLHH